MEKRGKSVILWIKPLRLHIRLPEHLHQHLHPHLHHLIYRLVFWYLISSDFPSHSIRISVNNFSFLLLFIIFSSLFSFLFITYCHFLFPFTLNHLTFYPLTFLTAVSIMEWRKWIGSPSLSIIHPPSISYRSDFLSIFIARLCIDVFNFLPFEYESCWNNRTWGLQ